jgi:hypothetical protein
MLKDVIVFGGFAGGVYAWLCAIVAPLATALRSWLRQRGPAAAIAVALALGAAVLWTLVPLAMTLLGMMLEPRAGLVLLHTRSIVPGLSTGVGAWLVRAAVAGRPPRFGATFEAATAMAIVATIDDDGRTLAKVERLYRALAVDGSRNVNTAPPSGRFDAWTSPPCRATMARTIDRPRPLPEGTRVPAREASTL